jgi:hypothetical protein
VTSSKIIKNDAAVNLPHSNGLGAMPPMAAAALFSISIKQRCAGFRGADQVAV